MITLLIRRLIPLATLGILVALVVTLNRPPSERSDLWFHLRMGDGFLEGWPLASPGHLGAYDSASWVPTQWLSQMAMAAIENAGGLTFVLTVSALLQAATLAVVFLTCRGVAGPLASALATLTCFLGLAAALSPRPQVASYLLFALTAVGWRLAARTGRPPLWLVPLTWVWVPLHGMWPIAIAFGFVMALGLSLDGVVKGRARLLTFGVPVLSLVLAMATPLGPRVYAAIGAVSARRQYFAEWAAPDFTDVRTLGVVVMLAVILIVRLRGGAGSWTTVLLVGVAVVLAIYSYRTLPLAAIVMAPLMAEAVQQGMPPWERAKRPERLVLSAAVLLVATLVALLTPSRAPTAAPEPWLEDRLSAMPEGTRVLNDWSTGGYFLWQAPQLDLAMHGYADVFTDDELTRNVDISRVQPGWDDLVASLDADYALVVPDTAMAYALTEHAGWTVLDGDDDFLLLSPPEG